LRGQDAAGDIRRSDAAEPARPHGARRSPIRPICAL